MSEHGATGEIQKHSQSEIANHYACQKIIRSWIQHPDYPSSQVIQMLHGELMKGVEDYSRKGLIPLAPGSYRVTDVGTEGKPDNFYVAGTDIAPTMQQYTAELDQRLQTEYMSPGDKLEGTINDAAWAYYVFERIHPFLDGSGRVGRMILKRVMKGRGYKDIIFQPHEIYSRGRNKHMDALDAVGNTGNLAHLEIYLLEQLLPRYSDENITANESQIRELITKKQKEIDSQSERHSLTDIWSGFQGLHLAGITPGEKTVAA